MNLCFIKIRFLGFLDSWIDIKRHWILYKTKKNRSNIKIESILVLLIFLFPSSQLFFLNPFWVLFNDDCNGVGPVLVKFKAFFFGTYFISIFVLLLVVSILFFRISSFFSSFDSLRWLFTKGFFHKQKFTNDLFGCMYCGTVAWSLYFSFKALLSSKITCLISSFSA